MTDQSPSRSNRPDDVPQDVKKAAVAAYAAFCDAQSRLSEAPTEAELLEVTARAILAERERCAEEANGVDPSLLEGRSDRFALIYCSARADAAYALRKGAA